MKCVPVIIGKFRSSRRYGRSFGEINIHSRLGNRKAHKATHTAKELPIFLLRLFTLLHFFLNFLTNFTRSYIVVIIFEIFPQFIFASFQYNYWAWLDRSTKLVRLTRAPRQVARVGPTEVSFSFDGLTQLTVQFLYPYCLLRFYFRPFEMNIRRGIM